MARTTNANSAPKTVSAKFADLTAGHQATLPDMEGKVVTIVETFSDDKQYVVSFTMPETGEQIHQWRGAKFIDLEEIEWTFGVLG